MAMDVMDVMVGNAGSIMACFFVLTEHLGKTLNHYHPFS